MKISVDTALKKLGWEPWQMGREGVGEDTGSWKVYLQHP